MTQGRRLLSLAFVVTSLVVLWLTRESVVGCWRDECIVRNRWTGKLTTRFAELPKLEPLPDSVRVLQRMESGDSQPGVNPYARFRRN